MLSSSNEPEHKIRSASSHIDATSWKALVAALPGPLLFSLLGSSPAAPVLVRTLTNEFRGDWLTAWGLAVLIQKSALILGLLLWICFWDRMSLNSLGLRIPNWLDLADAGLAFLAYEVIANIDRCVLVGPDLLIASRHVSSNITLASFADMLKLPTVLALSLSIGNGAEEELLFRAYTIERIGLLCGRVTAATIGLILSLLSHMIYWDVTSALKISLGETAFAALYLRKRSLPACIVAHSLSDALTFVVWPFIR